MTLQSAETAMVPAEPKPLPITTAQEPIIECAAAQPRASAE